LRYQSAADLRADLQRLKRDTESGKSAAAQAAHPGVARGFQPSGSAQVAPATASSLFARLKRSPYVWAAVVVLASVAGVLLFNSRRVPALTEKDSILLADFVNTTGDAVFDGTLKAGLAVQLEQSPFLNLLPQQRIASALRFMGRPADERVTTAVARE